MKVNQVDHSKRQNSADFDFETTFQKEKEKTLGFFDVKFLKDTKE